MNSEIKQRIEQIQNDEIPQGYKKGKIGIVPEDWEEVSFSSLFTSTSDYTDDLEKYPLCSLTIEDGITAKTERYDRSHLVKKDNSYKIVRPNDYAYNPMNLRFGAVARHRGSFLVAVSGYYDIFTTVHESDFCFMDSFLTCSSMLTYYNRMATGSLLEKQRVHFSDFLKFSLPMPPIEERKRIADILTTQDAVIECIEKKIEQLNLMKKYYLQTMFPRKGEKVPVLRFKGFNDDWKRRSFFELYEKVSQKNDLSFGEDKIISVANMYFKNNSSVGTQEYLKTYNVFQKGDIAFEGNKSKNFAHGRFVENTIGNGIVSHVFDVFRPKTDYDLLFWKYAINNEYFMGRVLVRCTKSSTMMTNLVSKDFLKESILVPLIEEQRKIGAFFDKLDCQITLCERKCDFEKQKKKSLMQLLLTGVVRLNNE